MQRAGGCKECTSSKINAGNRAGEGRQQQGDRQHTTDPKPQSLLRTSVPFVKNSFPAWTQDSICRSGVQTHGVDRLLDRSSVFPWTCCSAAGGVCRAHRDGPAAPMVLAHPRRTPPPWSTEVKATTLAQLVTLVGWLNFSPTETTKVEATRHRPNPVFPGTPPHCPGPGGGCRGAQQCRDHVSREVTIF